MTWLIVFLTMLLVVAAMAVGNIRTRATSRLTAVLVWA